MQRFAGGDVEAAGDERGQRDHLDATRCLAAVQIDRRVHMKYFAERLQVGRSHFFGRDAEPSHDVFRVAMDFARVRPQKSARIKTSWKLADVVVLDREQI